MKNVGAVEEVDEEVIIPILYNKAIIFYLIRNMWMGGRRSKTKMKIILNEFLLGILFMFNKMSLIFLVFVMRTLVNKT